MPLVCNYFLLCPSLLSLDSSQRPAGGFLLLFFSLSLSLFRLCAGGYIPSSMMLENDSWKYPPV